MLIRIRTQHLLVVQSPSAALTGLFTLSSAYILRLEIISVFKEQEFFSVSHPSKNDLISRWSDIAIAGSVLHRTMLLQTTV